MTQYLWVEKYRPDTIDNFIGNDTLKNKVDQFIKTGDVPHLLLSGPPGTGKTTAAKMIVKNIDCDFLYINASDENSIDVMRNKIKSFASSVGFKSLKVIVLDEADYITPNAQAALRNLMETFSKTTRFILTCNFVERIIDPIVSRTQHFQVIPPSKIDVAKHVWTILQSEKIEADKTDFKLLIDSHYPDIRKIINECQLASLGGQLVVNPTEIIDRDHNLKIIEILASKMDGKQKFQTIRQVVADAKIRDFAYLYTLLYEKVDQYAPNNISGTILTIAEGQYKDVVSPDKEICAMATLIQIIQGIK